MEKIKNKNKVSWQNPSLLIKQYYFMRAHHLRKIDCAGRSMPAARQTAGWVKHIAPNSAHVFYELLPSRWRKLCFCQFFFFLFFFMLWVLGRSLCGFFFSIRCQLLAFNFQPVVDVLRPQSHEVGRALLGIISPSLPEIPSAKTRLATSAVRTIAH